MIGDRSIKSNSSLPSSSSSSAPPIENILSRLDKVRAIGPDRWNARCPAHPDKSPSLAIRELDDGRVLLHCFTGCDISAILGALGLEFSDLYPPKPDAHGIKPERRPFSAADVLKMIAFEATVVLLAARDMLEAGDLVIGSDGFSRLEKAANRIQSALTLAGISHG